MQATPTQLTYDNANLNNYKEKCVSSICTYADIHGNMNVKMCQQYFTLYSFLSRILDFLVICGTLRHYDNIPWIMKVKLHFDSKEFFEIYWDVCV